MFNRRLISSALLSFALIAAAHAQSIVITLVGAIANAPTFSPVPGTYSSAQTVTLSTVTPAGVIHCTQDGSTPTSASPVCSTLNISTTTTIKALTVASGYTNSTVSTGLYTISTLVVITTGSLPGANQYDTSYSQTLSASGGAAPYTWSIVSQSSRNPLTLQMNPSTGVLTNQMSMFLNVETISLIVKVTDASLNTNTKTFTIPVTRQVPAGAAALGYTKLYWSRQIKLSDINFAAYGVNGGTDWQSGWPYTNPLPPATLYSSTPSGVVQMSQLGTVSAGPGANTAIITGGVTSNGSNVPVPSTLPQIPPMGQGVYIGTQLAIQSPSNNSRPAPFLIPFEHNVAGVQDVDPNNSGAGHQYPELDIWEGAGANEKVGVGPWAGAGVYWNTAGTSPPKLVTSNATVPTQDVRAEHEYGASYNPSNGQIAHYIDNAASGTSGIDSTTGVPMSGATLSFFNAMHPLLMIGAFNDSTTPYSMQVYEVAVWVNPSVTNAAAPTFSPVAGSYTTTQTVTISDATSGAFIYYTTDGSTPTVYSTLYTAPITVSASQTVNAIALAPTYASSVAGTAVYNIGTSSFDYFVSPNGDDNNAGSLAAPWSISALNSLGASSKASLYRGKKICIIGDIGGVQTPIQYGTVGGVQKTLYAMLNAVTTAGPAINIDGGTNSASTYIGSCNSSGAYVRGWAIINAANPANGAHSTAGNQLMGQSGQSATQVAHPGYVTIDGITFVNFDFSALAFEGAPTSQMVGIIIENSEFSGSNTAATGNNPGAVRLQGVAPQVLNSKFHDCASASGSFKPAYSGIMSYDTQGLIVTNDAFWNIDASVQQKDSNQDAVISYSYLDYGSFGNASGATTYGAYYEGINAVGRTTTMHHNILVGPVILNGSPANYGGTYTFYNNTVYLTQQNTWLYTQTPQSTGVFNSYNNVIYSAVAWGGTYGTFRTTQASSIPTFFTFDYNYYRTAPFFWINGTTDSFATWQGLGIDTHSTAGGSPFASTPTSSSGVPNYSSFTLNSSSPAHSCGKGGAICGALDGTGTIGPSW